MAEHPHNHHRDHHRVTTAIGPVVISVPHAGLEVPVEDAALLALPHAALTEDADLYVDELVAPCVDHATIISTSVSRYICDLNRSPDDVDADVCPQQPRTTFSSPRGLCWRLATDGRRVLPRPLLPAEVEGRIARVHRPYHDKLTQLMDDAVSRCGFALLLDLHSMPGRATTKADVVPGDLQGRSCHSALMAAVTEHFRSDGLRVVPNDPYRGGYITQRHGAPHRNRHAIQIELARPLYLDESNHHRRQEHMAKLQHQLLSLVQKLEQYPPSVWVHQT